MIRSHGGGCCGIRHSSGYSAQEETAVRTLFQDIGQCPQGRMLEVVLTDGQLRGNRLSRVLVTAGFKLVYRFRNANSGNICNVFHRHNAPLPLEDLPFSLEPYTPEENPYRQDDLSLPVGWCRVTPNVFPRGACRIRIHSPRSMYHGRELYYYGSGPTRASRCHVAGLSFNWSSILIPFGVA